MTDNIFILELVLMNFLITVCFGKKITIITHNLRTLRIDHTMIISF